MTQDLQFTIDSPDQGKRLDKFLCDKMPEYSRAIIQKMIKEKNIQIGEKEIRSSYRTKAGDIVEINLPKNKIDLSPDSSIKFDIIHDEKDFVIISKPAGMVVYPGTKHNEKNLVNGLLAVWPEIKNVGEDPLRPGIVHRLDKDTSGIMIIAKNNSTFEYFKDLFKNRKIKKTYLALVHGILEPREGIIDFPIRRSTSNPVKQIAIKIKSQENDARPALTRFAVRQYLKDSDKNEYSLTEAIPETGRMHQIRVHFAALGHNIVGDKIYQNKKIPKNTYLKSHFLHASNITFISPAGKTLNFSSPLSKELNDFLKTLTNIHLKSL